MVVHVPPYNTKLDLSADENIVDYDRFISAIKMAHVMQDWISEKNEKYISDFK